MDTIIVRLSKKNNYKETYDLVFDLIPSPFLHKWIERYLEAQQRQDPISEPWALYNLGHEDESDVVQLLNQHIDFCNSMVPNMFERKLLNINDQDSLNYIHSVFETTHGKLDEWLDNPLFDIPQGTQLRSSLSQINQLVHKCEGMHRKDGAKIRVVWFDLPKTKTFDENDYKLFTNNIDFGGLYTLYADVGKNLEALASDNDNHVHDFVPNIHYSADFHIKFYDRLGDDRVKKYEKFLSDNYQYFLNKGYTKNDVRLTTGNIKLAQLRYSSKQSILDKLKKYNNIQSVFLF